MEETLFLSTRCWIPSHLVDEDEIDELYTHFQFAEHKCKRCPIRPRRPANVCWKCPGFMGETQLYSKRQTENGIFWGIPLAQHKKALELLQLDDLPREDMRKKIPFPQKLKFTGKLHDGTANH